MPGPHDVGGALWGKDKVVLFERRGKGVYLCSLNDGELLDTLVHSDPEIYRATMERIRSLGAEVVHAGHYPSFGAGRRRTWI